MRATLEDAVEAARREAHRVGGLAHEGEPLAVRPGDLLEHLRRAGGVGRDPGKPEIDIALRLPPARRGDPRRDLGRAFGRRRQHHVGGGDRRHLDDEVDAVEQRPREAGLVLRHAALVRLPAAGEARLGRLAAAARVLSLIHI